MNNEIVVNNGRSTNSNLFHFRYYTEIFSSSSETDTNDESDAETDLRGNHMDDDDDAAVNSIANVVEKRRRELLRKQRRLLRRSQNANVNLIETLNATQAISKARKILTLTTSESSSTDTDKDDVISVSDDLSLTESVDDEDANETSQVHMPVALQVI